MPSYSCQAIIDAVRSVVRLDQPVGLHEPELSGRERDYLNDCIDSGWVSYKGTYVDRFERSLATLINARHAIATVNGTVALHLALLVAGVRAGDEVLVPSLTFAATANAVAHCHAIPHFVDSELATLGVDPDRLASYLEQITEIRHGVCRNRATGRTIRAVVPVHIFGHPVRMRELLAIANRLHLTVIEDAAEALGSRMNNRPVGGDGLMSVLSFNGNKIVTTGGGGAVITNDDALANRIKHLSTTAKMPHPYAFVHDEVGYNYRLPNINAALGCAQLEQLEGFLRRKRQLAAQYQAAFAPVSGVSFFREPRGASSNYWLNAVLLDADHADDRDLLLEQLNGLGLNCRPVWTPMHQLPMYARCPHMELSICEEIAGRLINLPSSPRLAAP